jgi:thioredoxin reductase (NADPH)
VEQLPVILAVDDDPLVLAAVVRDLEARYQTDYRIVGAGSGYEALEVLNELTARGAPAALLLADQRMPGMTGVEFLEAARRLDESSRRILLTAYADTEAAIAAVNLARASHYLLKPWEPPAERLYPALDDDLAVWRAGYRPGFSGIRVLGDRFDVATHDVKDFLARNQIPYQVVDAGGDEGASLLKAIDLTPGDLPVVLLEDGSRLVNPGLGALAEAVHLRTRPELETYDLVIVGAGPAGLAAAVYAASEGLDVIAIERQAAGGQAGQSARIENYLGFPAGLTGAELTRRAVLQAGRFHAEMVVPVEAVSITRNDPFRVVTFADGKQANARSVIIATGVSYRTLLADGASDFAGQGVFYGASPVEAQEYKGEPVAVIGAGNSAGQAAIYLAGYAQKVTLIVRGKSLAASMSSYLVERIEAIAGIEVLTESTVRAVNGDEQVRSLDVESGTDVFALPCRAVFVFIGQAPRTEWLPDELQRDDQGFILTGRACAPDPSWALERLPLELETSIPGVFAVGDVRAGSIKRIASAAGEGAMAVSLVHQHLARL